MAFSGRFFSSASRRPPDSPVRRSRPQRTQLLGRVQPPTPPPSRSARPWPWAGTRVRASAEGRAEAGGGGAGPCRLQPIGSLPVVSAPGLSRPQGGPRQAGGAGLRLGQKGGKRTRGGWRRAAGLCPRVGGARVAPAWSLPRPAGGAAAALRAGGSAGRRSHGACGGRAVSRRGAAGAGPGLPAALVPCFLGSEITGGWAFCVSEPRGARAGPSGSLPRPVQTSPAADCSAGPAPPPPVPWRGQRRGFRLRPAWPRGPDGLFLAVTPSDPVRCNAEACGRAGRSDARFSGRVLPRGNYPACVCVTRACASTCSAMGRAFAGACSSLPEFSFQLWPSIQSSS